MTVCRGGSRIRYIYDLPVALGMIMLCCILKTVKIYEVLLVPRSHAWPPKTSTHTRGDGQSGGRLASTKVDT